MLSLVLVLDPSTWMMLYVLQVLANYWSATASQFQLIIVLTLLMLVLGVKVIFSIFIKLKPYIETSYQAIFPYFSSMLYWSAAIGGR